jgi:hypothetical protein
LILDFSHRSKAMIAITLVLSLFTLLVATDGSSSKER